MKDFVFKKDQWLLDLAVCASFGVFFGYVGQVEADSEGTHPEGVVLATFIGGFSYVLVYLTAIPFRERIKRVPSWVWLGVVGSILKAFGIGAIVFAVKSWDPNRSLSVPQHLSRLVPYMMGNIMFLSIVFSVLAVTILIFVRTAVGMAKLFFDWITKNPLK